jgi:glycosyltransferase involved in cell wall biosynthesis
MRRNEDLPIRNMRLAFINQFYPPDLAPTGQLAASLAGHRAALGDQVTVIAGSGRYVPESVPAASGADARIRIYRLWTPGLGKVTSARRLIDYTWFYMAAALRMLWLPRQDVIIALTTPPFIAWAAALHRRLHPSTRLVLWNMDCYPEALIRGDLIPERGWIARLLQWQNRWLFRQLDHLVCLDSAMEQLLTSLYTRAEKSLPTTVIPNWEPAARFLPADTTQRWDLGEQLDLKSRLCVLHLGNTGYGHSFETVAEAAELLREAPVAFVFVGGGARWSWLETTKRDRGLARWHMIRYLPEDQLMAAMAAAGCALITLRDTFLGVISPSKLHAALGMGLPILYVGPEGSNVDEAIRRHGCGASLRHGDVQGVVAFLRQLGRDAAFAGRMRERARSAFESAYTDIQALPRFDGVIEGLSG